MSQSVATADTSRKRNKLGAAGIFEWSLATALTAAWLAFHVRFFLHAGALRRDEVNSVDLATSPTISDIAANLQHDSFPILWFVFIRFWIGCGIGISDLGLRVTGLLTGLGMLAAIWLNARRFRYRTPIATLALLGFASAMVIYGDSIRAYGPGVLLELLTLGLIWDVATRPTLLRIVAALVVSLMAVQTLFYNSVILFALCSGGILVCLGHRHFKRAAIILTIGIVCAVSMLPYRVLTVRSASFRAMLVHPPTMGWLVSKFVESVGYDKDNPAAGSPHNAWMWGIAIVISLLVALTASRRFRGSTTEGQPIHPDIDFRKDVLIYHLTVLLIGIGAYWVFLHALAYTMQPWYYLALLALIATCIDGLFSSLPSTAVRVSLCLAAICFCASNFRPVWHDAGLRKTSLDYIATDLPELQRPGNLIIISPWFYAITFQRYYHGPAEYLTIPPMDFIKYQKYEQIIPAMQNVHAMDPVLQRIAATLKSGHDVILLGDFEYPDSNTTPPKLLPPAPSAQSGWEDSPYYFSWRDQITFFLKSHTAGWKRIKAPVKGISGYEHPNVFALWGFLNKPDHPKTPPK